MAKRLKLSKKKKKWIKQTKPTATMRGGALNFPVTVERKYTRDVKKILKKNMTRTEREVTKFLSQYSEEQLLAKKYEIAEEAGGVLDRLSKQLTMTAEKSVKTAAKKMVSGANKSSQANVATSLKELSGGVTLKPSLISKDIQNKLNVEIIENVRLITKLTDTQLSKISQAVFDSIFTGNGMQDLVPFFMKERGVGERHAKNMALDQTRKAYNKLNVVRMESAGLSKFEWLHSGGGQKPRKFHIDKFPAGLNGGIYELKDPPIIDEKTGETGLPSQLPNCKCRMIPVISLDEGEEVP